MQSVSAACHADADCPGNLPSLPSDVVDRILSLVKEQWRARPEMRAKDEVSRRILLDTPLLAEICSQSLAWLNYTASI